MRWRMERAQFSPMRAHDDVVEPVVGLCGGDQRWTTAWDGRVKEVLTTKYVRQRGHVSKVEGALILHSRKQS